MGLFLVLFWYSAVAGDALRYNSRFHGFNSRLSRRKFPFPSLRELAGKRLIYPTVFAVKDDGYRRNREDSRFHGNNREFCRHRRNERWHSLQRRRSALPAPIVSSPPYRRVQPFASDEGPRARPSRARYRHRLATVAPSPLMYYLNASEH